MRYLLLVAVIVAGITGYYAYWSYLAEEMQATAERWIDLRQHEGFDIEHDGFEVRGFPYRLTLTVGSPRVGRPADAVPWQWQADYLAIYLQPWDFSHLVGIVEGRQKLVWQQDDRAEELDIDSRETRFSLRADGRGRAERVIGESHQITFTHQNGMTANADKLQAAVRFNYGSETSRPDGSVDAAIRFDALDLPRELRFILGPNIALFKLEGFLPAPLPAGTAAADAAAWRDGGGRLDIRDLAVTWGPLDITGKGKVRLDDKLRPFGRMAAALRGYGDTLRAFSGSGGLSEGQASAAIFALNLLARNDAEGRRVVNTDLVARDGKLHLGPVALVNLPPLW